MESLKQKNYLKYDLLYVCIKPDQISGSCTSEFYIALNNKENQLVSKKLYDQLLQTEEKGTSYR